MDREDVRATLIFIGPFLFFVLWLGLPIFGEWAAAALLVAACAWGYALGHV